MKLRTIAIIIGSFFVGIAAGMFALSSIPQLNPEEWSERAQATIDPLDPNSIASIGLEGIRAEMSRADIEISNYYLADYTEILQWLDRLEQSNDEAYSLDLSQEERRAFVQLRDTLSFDNLEAAFASPDSIVNTALGLVYKEMTERVDGLVGYENEDFQIESCLALRENETTGRDIFLYLKIPNGDTATTQDVYSESQITEWFNIPSDWQVYEAPPPETDTFKSECFSTTHLLDMIATRPELVPASRQYLLEGKDTNDTPSTTAFNLSDMAINTDQADTQVNNGRIDNENPFVEYDLTVEETGSTIQVTMDKTNEADSLDTLLYLVNSSGAIVAQNDDRVRGNTNSTLLFPQATAGDYTVIATRYKVDRGNSTGGFQVQISVAPPTENTLETYAVSDADLAAVGFPVDQQPKPENEWTVLAYYGADTDLEPGIIKDFNEFEIGLQDVATVNVVVMLDRHPRYTDSNGNWDSVRLYEVSPDVTDDGDAETPTIDTQPIAEMGELNMGDGQTFAQFLVWGMKKYPARNYAVAFASHGAGWQGLISDETDDNALLSVPDLTRALETARAETGLNTFDLLINDACLMSSVEYYSAIDNYFDYSLASPEVVINPALDMTKLTQDLAANLPLEELGIQLVNTYITRDIPQDASDAQYLSHALTDLRVFDPVTVAVERFASLVNSNRQEYYPVIRDARLNAYTYTRFLGDSTRIDIGDLMTRVIDTTSDETLVAAAQAVLDALDTAILHGEAGERAARATTYYNIYFPEASEDFDVQYLLDSPLSEWAQMLRGYYNFVTPSVWDLGENNAIVFHPPIAPEVNITSSFPAIGSIRNGFRVGLDVRGRNLSSGELTIDLVQDNGTILRKSTTRLTTPIVDEDGNIERINSWREGFNTAVFDWDVSLPVVTDGSQSTTALVVINPDDNVAFLDGQYREDASDTWKQVTIAFDSATNAQAGTVQRVLSRSEGSEAVAAVEITPGSDFQVFNNVVTADGRVVREPGTTFTWPEGGVTWTYEPAPSGTYNLAVVMTAAGGTTGFDATQVEVNNEGLDPAIRGDGNWADLGVVLPRLADYENWVQIFNYRGDQVAYRALQEGTHEAFGLYFLFQEGDYETQTLEEMAPIFGERYNLEITSIGDTFILDEDDVPDGYTVIQQTENFAGNEEVVATLENGVELAVVDDTFEALEIEYTFTDDDGAVVNGRGFIFRQTNFNDFAFMLGAETDEGIDRLNEIYPVLRDNLDILDFDPQGVVPTNLTSDIDFAYYGLMLLPKDWTVEIQETEDGWQKYINPAYGDLTHISMYYSDAYVGSDSVPTAREILSDLQDSTIASGGNITTTAENFRVLDDQVLYGQFLQWQAIVYDVQRGDQALRGRLYVSLSDSNEVLAVWAETPIEFVDPVIPDVVEPGVDSYQY